MSSKRTDEETFTTISAAIKTEAIQNVLPVPHWTGL